MDAFTVNWKYSDVYGLDITSGAASFQSGTNYTFTGVLNSNGTTAGRKGVMGVRKADGSTAAAQVVSQSEGLITVRFTEPGTYIISDSINMNLQNNPLAYIKKEINVQVEYAPTIDDIQFVWSKQQPYRINDVVTVTVDPGGILPHNSIQSITWSGQGIHIIEQNNQAVTFMVYDPIRILGGTQHRISLRATVDFTSYPQAVEGTFNKNVIMEDPFIQIPTGKMYVGGEYQIRLETSNPSSYPGQLYAQSSDSAQIRRHPQWTGDYGEYDIFLFMPKKSGWITLQWKTPAAYLFQLPSTCERIVYVEI